MDLEECQHQDYYPIFCVLLNRGNREASKTVKSANSFIYLTRKLTDTEKIQPKTLLNLH